MIKPEKEQKNGYVCGNDVKRLLEARKEYLEKIKNEKRDTLKAYPDGKLRVCCYKGKTHLYYRKDPKEKNGTYIPVNQKELARQLAQKDYDERILRAIKKEEDALEKGLQLYPQRTADSVFSEISAYRQDLVIPIREDDEAFVQRWNSVEYHGKDSVMPKAEFITDRGEYVRSKSELIIANLLYKEKIPYRYEYPVVIKELGKVYPDFTVLNIRLRKEILWEHLGMRGDWEYSEKVI